MDKYFDGGFNGWRFINQDSLELGVGIKHIVLSAKNPSSSYNHPPQSAIRYEFFNSLGEKIGFEVTGVVENYENIVIHNTRSGFFKALFSFPWPTIKFPISDHQEWEWKFAYDSNFYGDERFFKWDGITEMKYQYKYLGEKKLTLDFGKIQTSKFEALGSNGIISNKLVYYFNSELGFVKQEFFTHDGAKIEFVAVDYSNKCVPIRN